ncbi:WXG100 family type VII secretion target [Streptomyces orinoci]|uniref:WXG100 family type VII secretion target n=1 Tax=Streptomyces orinoci TaxID=67339 RepID=A0ABV3K6D5_STRON|nr:WXG100 family type VII secretion target [Streptomyces orinoci]
MSSKQKISEDAFNQFTSTIDVAIEAFNKNVQKLQSAILAVEGNWKGQAHAAFQQAQTELNEDHMVVNKLIQEIREAVGKTHTMGGANDGDIAASMKGVSALDHY